MLKFLLLLVSLFSITVSFAQTPVADFSLPEEVCTGENISFRNNSSNASRYFWDFCNEDLTTIPTLTEVFMLSEGNAPLGITVKYDGEKNYGLITNFNNNKLFSFTSDQNDNYTYNELAISVPVQIPDKIKLIEEEGVQYALFSNANRNSLVRLSLNDELNDVIEESELAGLGLSKPRGLAVTHFQDEVIAVVGNQNNNTITIMNFGSSVTNSPVSYTIGTPLINLPLGLALAEENGTLYGFIASRNNGKIIRIKFNSNLLAEPTFEEVAVVPDAAEIDIVKEGNYFQAFIVDRGGRIHRLDFKNGLANSPEVANPISFSALRNTQSLDIIRNDSLWIGFTINQASKQVYKLTFQNLNCPYVNESYSEEVNPQISYNETGIYAINLTAYDEFGNRDDTTQFITVTEGQAPIIDMQLSSQCIGSASILTSTTNQPLTSTTWIINGDTLTNETVTYDFPAPGTYPVTLEVQSENGCGNRLTKEITIYEPPAPGFTAPSGQICTNGAVNFANTTDTKGAESLITYRWLVDGELVSEEANPAITFAEGGSKTVRLEAGIPGCTEVIEQTVNVQQGPTVSFAVPQVCEGAPVAFENLTSGEDITGYQWDFGDGGTFSSAIAESPTYAFEAAGTYEVALSVSNAAGCLNTYRQEVVVYQQPSVGFLSEVACVGTPTQFTDTTTAGANANIIAWQWDFGDGNTAAVKNPAHVYQQPGTYTVRLTAQSTAGCEASTEQTITVESPVAADFLVDRTCPTEEAPYLVQLTDVSTVLEGEEVTQWFWTIEGQTFTTPNVTYAFREPGRYEVSLTAFASSACNATVTKTIQVDTLPTVTFTYENACVGSPLAFESQVVTPSVDTSGETVSGYTWSFGDVGTALEANPTFVFEEAGTYEVRLTVQTESGCTFTTSQPVTIGEAPVAEFTASSTFGGAPLTVSFTHPADASTQYRWNFGGQGTSVEPNPTFIFTELGTYPVTLTATNAVGCVDTFSQTITVVEPAQDVQLTDIEVLDGPNGTQQLVLTLQNAGTLLVPSLGVTVDLGDAASLQALMNEPLLPGQTLRYPLNFQLPVPVPNQSNVLRYVCASVILRNADFEETDLDNNRACVSLNQQLSVEAPFPNPATEEVQLSLILPQASPVALRMMNAQGKVLRQQTVAETQSGLNTFLIPLRGLPVGSYILQVVYRGEQQRFRVAVGL